MIKAQTLGASTWQVVLRVALPQTMPRLIEALRLSLGPACLFLISAEAIAAESGLGYRIFLVRRYLAMDVILPYVAWITLLAFLMDFGLAKLARRRLRLGPCPGAPLMSAIEARDIWRRVWRPDRPGARQPRHRSRLLRLDRRPVGLRQVDLPAPAPGPGAADARPAHAGRGADAG